MKHMTCRQLGGACGIVFHAETFTEMAELSKKHGIEMMQKGDKAHIEAINEMRDLMVDPDAVKEWFEKKMKEFDKLPHE